MAVSFIVLIALVSSTFVESSRKLSGEGCRGDKIPRHAGAVPRLDPVPVDSNGAEMHNQQLDHERGSPQGAREGANARLLQLLPLDHTTPIAGQTLDFSWTEIETAAQYRLEVEVAYGKIIFSTVLPSGIRAHRVPSWKLDGQDGMRWRVVALDQKGKPIADTPWRILLPLSSECEN